MDEGTDGKPVDAGIQHNPTYETDSAPNNKPLSNGNECPDAVTDDNSADGYNIIPLQATSDYQSPNDDTTYNHIVNGPTRAITTDKTYAHIPNTAAARFDKTYSHLLYQTNRHEQDNVNDPEDSTYNHIELSDPGSSLSGRNNNRQIWVKKNSRKDDTYSHINPINYMAHNKSSNAAYEDSTYNHLGDKHARHPTKSLPCGQRPNISNTAICQTQSNAI